MKTPGRLLAVLLMLTTIGCDRVTKHFAETNLADSPPQSFLGDMFRLDYVENTGAFLSLGADWPEWMRIGLLTVGVAALLVIVAFLAIRRRWTGWLLAGAALLWAGGVSNLVDRIFRGSVVDFMNLGIGSLRTGVFNIADIAILAGALVIAFGGGGKDEIRNSSSAP